MRNVPKNHLLLSCGAVLSPGRANSLELCFIDLHSRPGLVSLTKLSMQVAVIAKGIGVEYCSGSRDPLIWKREPK
jgi:hypothetical protein